MTLNRTTNDIKTYSGQTFTTEKFLISKIVKRVRLLTNLQELLIEQFVREVIEDFCKKTWILRKLIQVGDTLTEVDNDSNYNMVEIDLEDYADGLLVHDINEITVNDKTYLATRNVYLGDPTGKDTISTVGPGAYIEADTFIGATTYVGATVINDGELTDTLHYEIVDDTTIKIWPIDLDDIILVPVVFKTSTVSTITEIPFIIQDYYKEIASGVITEMMGVQGQGFIIIDEAYHRRNYMRGISRGKYQYAKQYKGTQIQKTYFAI